MIPIDVCIKSQGTLIRTVAGRDDRRAGNDGSDMPGIIGRTFLFILMFGSGAAFVSAQQHAFAENYETSVNSLAEIRNKRRVLLVARRSQVVDASGSMQTIIEQVYQSNVASAPPRGYHHRYAHDTIARQLNKYIRKHKSISAVDGVAAADFIIYFNVLEMRRSLGMFYPYGEMYVISNEAGDNPQPRVIWRSKKGSMWAEDAAKDFLKELRAVRGEK